MTILSLFWKASKQASCNAHVQDLCQQVDALLKAHGSLVLHNQTTSGLRNAATLPRMQYAFAPHLGIGIALHAKACRRFEGPRKDIAEHDPNLPVKAVVSSHCKLRTSALLVPGHRFGNICVFVTLEEAACGRLCTRSLKRCVVARRRVESASPVLIRSSPNQRMGQWLR